METTIDHPLSPSSSTPLTSPISGQHYPPTLFSTTSSPRQGMEPESLASSPRLSSSSSSPSLLALGKILTSNTSFYDIPITDAFTELMERYVPVDQRPERHAQPLLLNLEEPPADELATMVMNHHWRAVARWARQKLVQTAPQDFDTILQLWHVRLLALFQLGLYQLASAEFGKLGDMIQHVPFPMQVLWAILPFQLDHPLVTLERLSWLAVQCQKKKEGQRELQVYLIMATRLIQMKDAHQATKILAAVLGRLEHEQQVTCRLDVMTGLGRLYLQLGDLATAERIYVEMEHLQKQHALTSPLLQETIQTNRAFLSMAKGDWTRAKHILEQVVQQNQENLTAVNNLAVCLVYTGQLSEALQLLESTTQQHPTTAGTSEPTLMNLCTLYELRFDGAALTAQKVNVVKQVARWVGDAFHPQCIKLP
ncbi:hypothetical protein BC941DRAFT_423490 [Chlamydoabsidia padenii]|nr:hypothetical protein BC941DRAFT_423490 [Chlamydoabsidia padenii]